MRHPEDYNTLTLRARRVLAAVLGSWVQRRAEGILRCIQITYIYIFK